MSSLTDSGLIDTRLSTCSEGDHEDGGASVMITSG